MSAALLALSIIVGRNEELEPVGYRHGINALAFKHEHGLGNEPLEHAFPLLVVAPDRFIHEYEARVRKLRVEVACEVSRLSDLQSVMTKEPRHDFAQHALAGTFDALKHNSDFSAATGSLDAMSYPIDHPFREAKIVGADDIFDMMAKRVPVTGLGPDAEPRPEI